MAERVSSSTAFARVLVSHQWSLVALQEPSDQIRDQVERAGRISGRVMTHCVITSR